MRKRVAQAHSIEQFGVGTLVTVHISKIDRASTAHRCVLAKTLSAPHQDRYQLLTLYGVLNRHYPTPEL